LSAGASACFPGLEAQFNAHYAPSSFPNFSILQSRKKRDPQDKPRPSKTTQAWHKGDGPYDEVDIPGFWFYRIPHKVITGAAAVGQCNR